MLAGHVTVANPGMGFGMFFRVLAVCLLFSPAVAVAEADAGPFAVTALPISAADATVEAVTSGRLDGEFRTFDYRSTRERGGPFWLRLVPQVGTELPADAALAVRKGRHLYLRAYDSNARAGQALIAAAVLPEYRGEQTALYALPAARTPGDPIYIRVDVAGTGAERLSFYLPSLAEALARGRAQTRMVAVAFGALMAMSLTALLICVVMPGSIFVWYATLFTMQALYIVFISGQGFEWPVLGPLAPLGSNTWNVPAALSGAAACLFIRKITDMRRYYPRHYVLVRLAGGSLRAARALELLAQPETNPVITAGGNLIFLGTAVYTLVIAFLAWLRGSRPAGWFLVAWGLLEVMTIWTAAKSIVGAAEHLLFYGLPLSMVAASILVALGIADRLREQRLALSDAERRAQTDPLTGVLNRRSLIERLHAACCARPSPRAPGRAPVHRPRPLQEHQRHARPPRGRRLPAGRDRADPEGAAQVRRDRALRRRGVHRDPEQRGRTRRADDRAAHPRARGGARDRGVRRADPVHVQHRRGGQRLTQCVGRGARSECGFGGVRRERGGEESGVRGDAGGGVMNG